MLDPGFVDLVKDALEGLYDPARLEGHPLGAWLGGDPPVTIGAQVLRQRLLDVIDELDVGPEVTPDSRRRRLHQVLHLRYVEALPVREVMSELALSERQ